MHHLEEDEEEESQLLSVFIDTSMGIYFELICLPFDTIHNLKMKIHYLEGNIPINKQHLLLRNEVLDDSHTLSHYGIVHKTTLKLVLGLQVGPINNKKVEHEMLIDLAHFIRHYRELPEYNGVDPIIISSNDQWQVYFPERETELSVEDKDEDKNRETKNKSPLTIEELINNAEAEFSRASENHTTQMKMKFLLERLKIERRNRARRHVSNQSCDDFESASSAQENSSMPSLRRSKILVNPPFIPSVPSFFGNEESDEERQAQNVAEMLEAYGSHTERNVKHMYDDLESQKYYISGESATNVIQTIRIQDIENNNAQQLACNDMKEKQELQICSKNSSEKQVYDVENKAQAKIQDGQRKKTCHEKGVCDCKLDDMFRIKVYKEKTSAEDKEENQIYEFYREDNSEQLTCIEKEEGINELQDSNNFNDSEKMASGGEMQVNNEILKLQSNSSRKLCCNDIKGLGVEILELQMKDNYSLEPICSGQSEESYKNQDFELNAEELEFIVEKKNTQQSLQDMSSNSKQTCNVQKRDTQNFQDNLKLTTYDEGGSSIKTLESQKIVCESHNDEEKNTDYTNNPAASNQDANKLYGESSHTGTPRLNYKETGAVPKLPRIHKEKKRCSWCKKRIGLATTYTCRCGKDFCGPHRYAETHDCTYDYRSEGRKALIHNSTRVIAPKLPKI